MTSDPVSGGVVGDESEVLLHAPKKANAIPSIVIRVYLLNMAVGYRVTARDSRRPIPSLGLVADGIVWMALENGE